MRGFVVVDLETTGFSYAKGDRIVEIGMVRTDPRGQIVSTWETLINPQRHVGATKIHGIHARDVVGAPVFADIAEFVDAELDGSVFVAHNAAFDASFICGALTDAGCLAALHIPFLDTMTLARRHLNLPNAKLGTICESLNIENTLAHSALADAVATAQILQYFIAETPTTRDPDFLRAIRDSESFDGYRYEVPRFSPRSLTRQQAREARDVLNGGWVAKAVAQRDIPDDAETAEYFCMLDAAFLDHSLSWTEQQQLLTFANERGLSAAALGRMHSDYLDALLRDGSETEAQSIEVIARFLGAQPSSFNGA